MNAEERKKAEENMGLVHKVISDKVHGTFQYGMYSREDLFQIGCIGLCKAVVSDRGGCFSTYAYRLIWNEICDALVSSTRNGKRETVVDVLPETGDFYDHEDKELQIEKGYTSREIGERFGVKANLVCAWVSKARKYLRNQEELRQMAEEYGYGTKKTGQETAI